MATGTFTNGLTSWTNDSSSTIILDTNNNGNGTETVNSVKLTNVSSKNTHLFSEKVAVSTGTSYSISAYLKVVSLSQNIGFYVDEYDANGNWVSGKYLYTKSDPVSGKATFSYTPSSSNVASASLQVIMVAGTGTSVYLDDIQWVKA